MLKLYAGIGSRQTPLKVIEIMEKLGYSLALRGYTLRSGAAKGADSAFEGGCRVAKGSKEIWLPWPGYVSEYDQVFPQYPTEEHYTLASTLHPAWPYLKQGVRALHARNTGQILGQDLNTPVQFVICYTDDGVEDAENVTKSTGGTGTAIKLASLRGIPVINLRNEGGVDRIKQFVRESSC